MTKNLIGDKKMFAIEYTFFVEKHETEIAMFVANKNVLEYKRGNSRYTTRWNIDSLAEWLREFLNNYSDDPYPVKCKGECAAEKDINAREFDTDNDDEFEEYYENLYKWNLRHRWHHFSDGAILSNVYFQVVNNNVEISWNNSDSENGVEFSEICGNYLVDKSVFYSVVDDFLKEYALAMFDDIKFK